MKKIVMVVLLALVPFSISAIEAGPEVDLSGEWVLALEEGEIIQGNGWIIYIPYVEFKVDIHLADKVLEGTKNDYVYYRGELLDYEYSRLYFYHYPERSPSTLENVFMEIPLEAIGYSRWNSPYVTLVTISVFISPDGNELYGVMSAKLEDYTDSVSDASAFYHGRVSLFRSQE